MKCTMKSTFFPNAFLPSPLALDKPVDFEVVVVQKEKKKFLS